MISLFDNYAKSLNRETSARANIFYFDFVQLLPNENYLQISNLPNGIAFDQNYKVELIDCSGKVVKDVTVNVAIQEFAEVNGTQQIAFEIANLGVDFGYDPLQLKFTHTVSDFVWWSSQFAVTSYNKHLTTRIDYKSYNQVLDFYQSTRLQTYFFRNDDNIEVGDYFQISTQRTISDVPRFKVFEKYIFEKVDNFVLNRLKRILTSDVFYFDFVRITNKAIIKDTEPKGSSNLQDCEFNISKDYNDVLVNQYYIHLNIEIIEFYPQARAYSLSTISNIIFLIYNKIITTQIGKTVKVFKNNVLVNAFETYTQNTENEVSLIVDWFSLGLGNYRIEVEKGFGVDYLGNETDFFTWNFTIGEGDFSAEYYNSVDFLTN